MAIIFLLSSTSFFLNEKVMRFDKVNFDWNVELFCTIYDISLIEAIRSK